MQTLACLFLLSAILSASLFAQTKASSAASARPEQINISAGVAEKLLIHKVDPDLCPHVPMPARITATVVVSFEIDTKENVLHPRVVSGPAMLRKAVLESVRKYKYQPYLLNGSTIETETNVSVYIDNYRDCHIE